MSFGTCLRLGTRQSKLALWQANWIASLLSRFDVRVELVPVTTGGDADDRPIGALGGVGVFTKAIQEALLDGQIDLAVHSLKDLPTEPVDGLLLGAVPERESPRDALISREGTSLDGLPTAARVGTGSPRRQAQLLYIRSDLNLQDIRGNVDTRLRKLDEAQYDAVVLAEAGLIRLDLGHRITQLLPTTSVLPAAGQGAVVVEVRADDRNVAEIVGRLDHSASRWAVTAERAMLAGLRGGCLAPVGAWARVEVDETLVLDGVVLTPDGRQRLFASASGHANAAEAIGLDVCESLLAQGAAELIARSRN